MPPLLFILVFMKKKILFVCLGNICRSCTAEEVFRNKVQAAGEADRFEIDSAGLTDYHEGELPDERMRATAARYGYNLTHRSRPVTCADFEHFDLIVAMDERNREGLLRQAPNRYLASKIVMMADFLTQARAIPLTHIPDPYYGEQKDFDLVVELLEEACEQLRKVV